MYVKCLTCNWEKHPLLVASSKKWHSVSSAKWCPVMLCFVRDGERWWLWALRYLAWLSGWVSGLLPAIVNLASYLPLHLLIYCVVSDTPFKASQHIHWCFLQEWKRRQISFHFTSHKQLPNRLKHVCLCFVQSCIFGVQRLPKRYANSIHISS